MSSSEGKRKTSGSHPAASGNVSEIDTGIAWPAINFGGEDPRFLVGNRIAGGHELDAFRVEIRDDVFADFQSICQPVMQGLSTMASRQFEPWAELEVGEEYFSLATESLTFPASSAGASDSQAGVASLIRAIRGVDSHTTVGPNGLADRYLYYAICWPCEGGFAGFVRKMNPRQVMERGRRFFQYSNALQSSPKPDMVLDDGVDCVVTPGRIAVLHAAAFRELASDVRFEIEHVGADVTSLSAGLPAGTTLPLAQTDMLARVGREKVSIARRLNRLPARLNEIRKSPLYKSVPKMRAMIRRHGVDPDTILTPAGDFVFSQDDVPIFMDLIEGRYYAEDWLRERRRADRYSKR
jgi:hypothetical protein